jgi:hypothetical protein
MSLSRKKWADCRKRIYIALHSLQRLFKKLSSPISWNLKAGRLETVGLNAGCSVRLTEFRLNRVAALEVVFG